MATSTAYFFDHVGDGNQQTLVYPLLQAELPRIISPHSSNSTGCLLADIGDFLVDVLEITTKLAEALVLGQYIREYTRNQKVALEQEYDLHTTDYLDDKHEALKSITSNVRGVTETIRHTWLETTPPIATQSYPSSNTPQSYSRRDKSLPIRNPSFASSSAGPSNEPIVLAPHQSEDSEDGGDSFPFPSSKSEDMHNNNEGSPPENEDESPSLEQLSPRGSGVYKCRLGERCTKGGVQPDGRIKIFARNSEYKAHVLKHEKVHKCDLPNCPNNGKGFARKDQLQRHKTTVKHEEN